ncbi:ImmA/IrrE family metallo-endopeptidase [uncultured Litoreibacter sp.]|uniref:ImmA/IrrE family metallo-endopeptidase n=1 Tax=uncultured Litoreibacter sp. TaxID=1392394 RepID=UPI002623FC1D|nr:ImmA/IrrE family metallo-endopeptidase [uncultured Litoreibacter sp.]
MSSITKSVETLLKKYKVTHPPVRVEDIAEGENVDVVFVAFEGGASDRIHGFYDHDEKKIYVNAADSAEEKQYTIAHELGHHVLHAEYAASEGYVPRLKHEVDTVQEREADDFATRLLVPSSFAPMYADLFSDREMQEMFLVTSDMLKVAKKTF